MTNYFDANLTYSYTYSRYINNVLYLSYYNIYYGDLNSYYYITFFLKTDIFLKIDEWQLRLLNNGTQEVSKKKSQHFSDFDFITPFY